MDQFEIATVLSEMATLMEIQAANPFKIRAYQQAARSCEKMEGNLAEMIAAGQLAQLSGIGASICAQIERLHLEGELEQHQHLRAQIAPGLLQMLAIPGLGAKKISKLHQQLGVESLDALKQACEQGKVAALKGFAAKTEQRILAGIEQAKRYAEHFHWWSLKAFVDSSLAALRAETFVQRAEVAGSYRRLRETVDELVFVIASDVPQAVVAWFQGQLTLDTIEELAEDVVLLRLENHVPVTLKFVSLEHFAPAWYEATGSAEHLLAVQQRAADRGIDWSAWSQPAVSAETLAPNILEESDISDRLQMDWIPPELREGWDECERASTGRLPNLIQPSAIRGVFHNHTQASDGRGTLAEMAAAAESLGLEYLGLADHSQASYQANGLNVERVMAQIAEVQAFNAAGHSSVWLFSGIECDILSDGSLDLDEATLGALDYCVMSVHSGFQQSEAVMTARIIRAIEHPATTMLGHPSGRLLLRREPYQVNLDKVIDAAIANRVIIELNANPHRLDLDWRYWRRAADRGLMCAINPDAHRPESLAQYAAGVNIARKGGLQSDVVLNTRNRAGVERWFQERR
jgi:DNA polymerase (family 10)